MCDKCTNPQTVWDKETVEQTGMCEECYCGVIKPQVQEFFIEEDSMDDFPEYDDSPKCPMCGSSMNQARDFSHGCGNICYQCS
jgi:oligoribonuclease (3'-5' exoribonuclease)